MAFRSLRLPFARSSTRAGIERIINFSIQSGVILPPFTDSRTISFVPVAPSDASKSNEFIYSLRTRVWSSSVDRSDEKADSALVYFNNDGNESNEKPGEEGNDSELSTASFDSHAEITDGDDSDDAGADYDEPLNPTQAAYQSLLHSIQTSIASLTKKTSSLQRELLKAQSLEDTLARANLITSNLYRLPPGTASAQVEDWEHEGKVVELVLNTEEYGSAQEEADALFALAKKMKRGSKVIEGLMKDCLEGEHILQQALSDLTSMTNSDVTADGDDDVNGALLDEGTLIIIQERLERTSKKTGFQYLAHNNIHQSTNNSKKTQQSQKQRQQPRAKKNLKSNPRSRYQPNPRELVTPSGHKLLIGRNRRDNEAICFQLSRPTDIWMHARGCPGAHVLLCVRRGSPEEVTNEDLQFAADLAAFYSDARTERRAEVTTAEPKHILKPRGAPPGAVKLRKEGRTLMGRPENVPDELKEAREKSGGAWDEMGYRRLGTRAKNKKRTAEVERERKKKGRDEAKEKNKRRKRKEENSITGFD